MKIGLLYGTETGNSELLCDDIEEALGDGYDCDIQNLSDVTYKDLDLEKFYIIVTASYGAGDLPTTAQPFYDQLEADKPDLSGMKFAIFGLGDMVFDETFNQGSERLMKLLLECKAEMIGERGMHDAATGDMPEDVALPWLETILPHMQALAA